MVLVEDVGIIRFADLPNKKRKYLLDLDLRTDISKQEKVPIFFCRKKNNGNIYHIRGYNVRDLAEFVKTAPPGLYYGGALIKIIMKRGYLVSVDNRYDWFRFPGGVANANEDLSLIESIRRELMEEIYVEKEGIHLIPPGGMCKVVRSQIHRFNFAKKIKESGSTKIYYMKNRKQKEFVAILEWRLDENEDDLIILHFEDCEGGTFGYALFLLDYKTNKPIGLFNMMNGFTALPINKFQETVTKTMRKKKNNKIMKLYLAVRQMFKL